MNESELLQAGFDSASAKILSDDWWEAFKKKPRNKKEYVIASIEKCLEAIVLLDSLYISFNVNKKGTNKEKNNE